MTALPSGLAPSRITIDLAALAANWRTMRDLAAGAETAAVVKADGYGLGAEPVTRALLDTGCRTFFIATAAEGAGVRRIAPHAVVYVLGGLVEGGAARLIESHLRPVLGSLAEAEEWAAAAHASEAALPAAIHVDTGMNRLGLTFEEAQTLADRLALLGGFEPTLVMSHLACADEPAHALNARQRDAFAAVRALFPGVPGSLANSAGVMLGPAYHHDLVRPGIALYGGSPRGEIPGPMRPVVRAEAQILRVRRAAAGETVGYGATQRLRRDTVLAILAAGYADGYHRAGSSSDARPGAEIAIAGRRAPLVGRVSMDLMAADVTDLPPGLAVRGAWAELFGDTVSVTEAAARAGTIDYELLTQLGRRAERVYVA